MTNVSVLWCAAVRDVLCTQFANNWTYYKKRAITLLPLVDSEQHCTKAGKTLQKLIKLRDFVWWYFNASWLILIFESRALFPSHTCLFISLCLSAGLFISWNELRTRKRAKRCDIPLHPARVMLNYWRSDEPKICPYITLC